MLRRRRPAPAAAAESNETMQLVPVFGVDPRGAAIFGGAVNGTMGRLNGRVVIDPNDAPCTGWVQQPQQFRSAIAGATGAGRPVVDRTTMLDQSRSTPGLSATQLVMEQRAARGRY